MSSKDHGRLWVEMQGLKFYLLDVFAEEKYAGNQLAVVRNTSALSSVQMQRIANEMHFSETTFILSDQEHGGGMMFVFLRLRMSCRLRGTLRWALLT